MDINKAIERVEKKYKTWILGSIKETFNATKDAQNSGTPLSAFILISCAIDFFAGFYVGINNFNPPNPGKNYKLFLKKYMSEYNDEDIYNGIRCKLVHNYTIGGDIKLTHNNNGLHNLINKTINFEDFLIDFDRAVSEYLSDLKNIDNKELREKFLIRYKLGFADFSSSVAPL